MAKVLNRVQIEELVQKLDTVGLVFQALVDASHDPARSVHAERLLDDVRQELAAAI